MLPLDVKLKEALEGGEQSRNAAIHELAGRPQEVTEWMVQGFHDKHGARILVPVVMAIGYPANERALPWLIEEIDRNSPAWREVVQAIGGLDPAIIVPYLIRKLWERRIQDANWCYDVESICCLLMELNRSYAAACGPMISSLLAEPVDPAQLDPGFLVDVIGKIGPNAARYALPNLLLLLERHTTAELRLQAMKLISTYDFHEREPYRLILSSIGRQESP